MSSPRAASRLRRRPSPWLRAAVLLTLATSLSAQAGSIRGVVHDKDFEVPLPAAQVLILETAATVTTSNEGNYVFNEVEPGTYTLVFSKEGYVRVVRADVLVTAGQLTDIDAWLTGEFTEMDEFIVQDILIGTGTEAALLELRFESPAFMDSISADLMSRAGASDAASALSLVSGATVQDGKFAVIRGLPDRYVSSQMNGVRLPTADEDKRAVELDLFPSAVIESIQVSKTFTPDQQGDASGGAVNVKLKSIPDEDMFEIKTQISGNSQTFGNDDFLTYNGGGISTWGNSNPGSNKQYKNIGENWSGAVGVEEADAPQAYKLAVSGGGKRELDDGVTIGGFASIFYEEDSDYFDNGKDNSYWVDQIGGDLVPQKKQLDGADNFKTALFDVTEGVQTQNYGGVATVGIETDNHQVGLTYLYSHSTEDTATLAEDTNGKAYFFPGYDPDDPDSPGNGPFELDTAPYLRTQTLTYTERTTSTFQLDGTHLLPYEGIELGEVMTLLQPEFDWNVAFSSASLDQPDKRQFGTLWQPEKVVDPVPPFFPGSTTPATYYFYKPDANFTLGNLQRIWKTIDEDSDQYQANLKLPFEQWQGEEGYFKVGWFDDHVTRKYDQETFSNFNDPNNSWAGDWDEYWSNVWEDQDHFIYESDVDVDYDGEQDINAYYAMVDMPLGSQVNLIGGYRWESTEISITNKPEDGATWYPPDDPIQTALSGGEADVDFQQDDLLPAIALEYRPTDQITVRASYTQTVARQTFKELTPVLQQEFLGGPIFIGNPSLQMAALDNTDLRVDYEPYEGSLVSASWFKKDVTDPIEYVQRISEFTYTTAVNYPEGTLDGLEFEVRQDLGQFWDPCEGLSVGANATFINSEVTLPQDEQDEFASANIQAPMSSRDMTNAPDHLYNIYVTYDIEHTGTRAALFYTVRGDTLVAGAGVDDNNFVPNVYEKEYGTLNFSLSQELTDRSSVQFQAKNLTNPDIEEVYRSDYTDEQVRTSYTKGIEFSLAYTIRF